MNASTTRSEVLSPRWKSFTKQVLVAVAAWHAMLPVVHSAETALADVPMTASNEGVPANVMLALSVEFPTAQSHANFSIGKTAGIPALPANSTSDPYFEPSRKYLGYFDPTRCYLYTVSGTSGYFYTSDNPQGANYTCSGEWSGNYLNWATMHVIDLFRWGMTGGARDEDLPSDFSAGSPTGHTILKKAWSNGQGERATSRTSPSSQHTYPNTRPLPMTERRTLSVPYSTRESISSSPSVTTILRVESAPVAIRSGCRCVEATTQQSTSTPINRIARNTRMRPRPNVSISRWG